MEYVEYQGDPVFTLRPLGDSHIGTVLHDQKSWLADIAAIRNDPYALTIGMGDYCECITLSDPRFEPDIIDPRFRDNIGSLAVTQRNAFIEDFTPIAKKCLGLLEGNHCFENRRRHYLNIVQDAADALGVPYLGDTAMIRLIFRRKDEDGKRLHGDEFVIYAEHGACNGTTESAVMLYLNRLIGSFDADLYLTGHAHKRLTVKRPILGIIGNKHPKPRARTRIAACTGAFLKTYELGTTSYGQRKSYPPVELGSIAIKIRPMRKEVWTEN